MVARALNERLAAEAPDLSVWIDRLELEGGVGWWNQIEQQLDRVEFLLLDAQGRLVDWGAPDHSVQLWQCDIVLHPQMPGAQVAAGRRQAALTGHRDRVQAVVIASKAGLVAACSLDKSVRVWRLDSGEPVGTLIGDSPMRTLQLSADHRLLAAGDSLGRVHLLRLASAC